MRLSTITVHEHSAQKVEALAAMGFDQVVMRRSLIELRDQQWADNIKRLQDHGIKVLLSWPEPSSFNDGMPMDDPRWSFKASDGRTNTSAWTGQKIDARLQQYSHWNDEVERAMIAELPQWLEVFPDIDGFHIQVSLCDRMFPTDWYAFGDYAIHGTRMYWSFDDHAQAKWAEFSAGTPMPTHPDPNDSNHTFYRWYQRGYIDRLTALTNAALDAGASEISTWFLPHTRWTAENMTGGTAGSVEPLEAWRQHVISRGVSPLMIVAHLFGLGADWPEWRSDGEETIRRVCAPPYNWDLIVGAECDIDGDTTPQRVISHGAQSANMGATGLFCSDHLWLGLPPEAAVAAAIAEVRPLFADNQHT